MNKNKNIVLIISLVLILTTAITGTIAYFSESKGVENDFSVAKITTEVVESIENGVKKDVSIKNTGTADCYIRSEVVLSWVDSNGNTLPKAVSDADCEVVYSNNPNWVKGADGFWYYLKPVAPDACTEVLISSATAKNVTGTDSIRLEILGSGIQARPADAVTESWGSIVSVNADGTLTVVEEGA